MEKVNSHKEDWLFYCQRSFSKNTYDQYRCVIGQLLKNVSQNGQQLTTQAIESFLDKKLQQGYSRKQWNCYLIAIRSFAAWREQRYNIPSPAHKIPFIREDPPKQRCLTEEEYQLCLQNTTGMDHDIICFLGNSGIRREEFRQLKWEAVDPQLKFIRIVGKGRKQRIVPLNETCREVLRKYKRLPANESVQFAMRYPGGEGASWMLRRIAKKIGIPQFGCHAIRHYFATRCIRKGISLYKLAKILGHSSIQTTEKIYIHLLPYDLLNELDVLD